MITTPQTTAKLTLSPEQIDKLPIGAVYRSQDGNATGTVKKTKDNEIEFTANCDSLHILIEELITEVYHFQKENTALKTELKQQKTEIVNEPTGWQWFQIYGFRIYAVLTISYIIYRRWKKK